MVSCSFSAKQAVGNYNFQIWKGPKLAGSIYLKPKPHNLYLFKSPGHLKAHISLGRNCWEFPISENHLKRILRVLGILGLGRLEGSYADLRIKQAFKWGLFHQQKNKPNFLLLFPNIKCIKDKKLLRNYLTQRCTLLVRCTSLDWEGIWEWRKLERLFCSGHSQR